MEKELLGVSLRSRTDFDLVKAYVDLKSNSYSKAFQVIMGKVADYYSRDGTATFVLPEVLSAQIQESIRNPKHVTTFNDIVAEAAGVAESDANVRAVVLMAKQQEVADKLAIAVTSGGGDVDGLLEEMRSLRAMTSLDDVHSTGMEVYHNVDLTSLLAKEYDPENIIKIYPSSLDDKLDNAVKRGHHITIFARPETGKSATCVNINCGMARHGHKSLYVINEDRPQSIILRHVANLSGMTSRQIEADPQRAMQLANDNGFQNIVVASMSPGSPQDIARLLEEHEPDAVFIDQLRNLKVKADNRVNQLEHAATEARNLGKKYNVLTFSVTQAGDSADNKPVLEMGDVDYSNTGIPAQADVMIGIGVDAKLEAEGLRMLSLPKNKISGVHDSFPVRIHPHLSRLTSV